MRLLFTICARAGSKGVKSINTREINGIPLLYYTLSVIELYQRAHPDNILDIVLNTDSELLIKQANSQNRIKNIRLIARKKEMANDTAAKVDVIRDCLVQSTLGTQNIYDAVVDLDLTSPMRRPEDVEKAVQTLKENQELDLAFSAVPARRNPYFNMVEQRGKFFQKVCDAGYTARQQAPAVYELNASIYVYSPEFLKRKIEKTILDYRGKIIEMPDYLVLDIDSEEDFELMPLIMEYYRKKDRGLERVINLAEKYPE